MSEISRFNPYRTFIGSWIPNVILKQRELSAGAKLTWARLAQYAGEKGFCFPKQKTLAEEIGCNKNTVTKYLNELVSNGFIEIVKPTGRDRLYGKSSRYYFLRHECLELEPLISESETNRNKNHRIIGDTESYATGTEENHEKENHEKENHLGGGGEFAQPSAKASVETPSNSSNKKNNFLEKVKKERATAQEKKELAMTCYEEYRKYMKLDDVLKINANEWNARQFTIFFFCGIAKYNFDANLHVRLPAWGRDVKTIERAMQVYGRERLVVIIKALCLRKKEVEKQMGKEFILDVSIVNVPWIIECAERVLQNKIPMGASREEKEAVRCKAVALQRERAEKLRKQLKDRKISQKL